MVARERAKNNDSEIFSPARQDFGFKSAAESHFPGSRIHLTLCIKNRNLPNRLKKETIILKKFLEIYIFFNNEKSE